VANPPTLARFYLAALIFLVVSGVVYGVVVRPFLLGMKQVQNLVSVREYARGLEAYRARAGSYPSTLAEAIQSQPVFGHPIPVGLDLWGNPISYSRVADGFLLVSYGRDGKPDGTNYEQLRREGKLDNAPCRDVNADQIVSDRGEHRTCGK
jgi:hypothetical protein